MIYIVIPVFNRKKFTQDCLDSLRIQTYTNFKTIVVDDGSTDGTLNMLKAEYPEVIAIDGGGDLWWTEATNVGIRHALQDKTTTHVMTLNNDTVATPAFIEQMYAWVQKKPLAILGACPLNIANNEPVLEGSLAYKQQELHGKNLTGLFQVTHYPGRGCLIPTQVFEKIGLFDTKNFPHYYADFDFTLTAHENGFEVFYNFDAKLLTYPDESGDAKNRKKKSWKNYMNHLFDIKGGGNLKDFTRFTLKHTPTRKLPMTLLYGYSTRLLGYWLK